MDSPIPIKIIDIKQERPDVKTFVLEVLGQNAIHYLPGQFLTFLFQHHKEERRSFSISSSPVLNEPLSITIKRVENGAYSRFLVDRACIGDVLYTTGAAGMFTIPANISWYRQVFFFAAGIGITPVFSLIKSILITCPYLQVILIYSNKSMEEVVFYDQLEVIKNLYPDRFIIEYLYSTSFNLSRARLSKWLLPKLLDEYRNAESEKMLFFTCGPFAYMRMVIITLEELGIQQDQIKKENFNTNERLVKKIEPPDKNPHIISLKRNGGVYNFKTQYPDTILQSAKKNGILLPYSCEVGRCGSCVALCTKGKVWLSYNEVLTDSEIAAGKILTCVAYPINGDADIEL